MYVYNAVGYEAAVRGNRSGQRSYRCQASKRKLSPLKLVQRFSPVAKGLGVMLLDTISAVAELKAMVNKGLVSYRLFIAEKG